MLSPRKSHALPPPGSLRLLLPQLETPSPPSPPLTVKAFKCPPGHCGPRAPSSGAGACDLHQQKHSSLPRAWAPQGQSLCGTHLCPQHHVRDQTSLPQAAGLPLQASTKGCAGWGWGAGTLSLKRGESGSQGGMRTKPVPLCSWGSQNVAGP